MRVGERCMLVQVRSREPAAEVIKTAYTTAYTDCKEAAKTDGNGQGASSLQFPSAGTYPVS